MAEKTEQPKKKPAEKEIKPKKDFHLFCPPHIDLKLEKGVAATVPAKFIDNLRTEKVI